MPHRVPTSLKLYRSALERRDAVASLITSAIKPSPAHAALVFQSFAFKNDELHFARELLRRKSQLWLFRSNQRAFCGDFTVIDVSSPWPERRRAFVIDLKLGAPVRLGGGGAGVQLRNAERAVREIARTTGALGPDPTFDLLTGDSSKILAFFGAAS